MFIYQVKEVYSEDPAESTLLFTHSKKYTEEEFKKIITAVKFDMGHFESLRDLPRYLEKYGFEEVVSCYY